MKFKTKEDIEKWFADHKYEEEVHEAIAFLLAENKKKTKHAPSKSTYRPKPKSPRTHF